MVSLSAVHATVCFGKSNISAWLNVELMYHYSFIMESGAKGCEVVVSGKLRAARAKSMKFTDGFMIHSGQPAKDFIDYATRHVLLRQGVLGIKVKIMRASSSPNDPAGEKAGGKGLPDSVTIIEPKEEQVSLQDHAQAVVKTNDEYSRSSPHRLKTTARRRQQRRLSTRVGRKRVRRKGSQREVQGSTRAEFSEFCVLHLEAR
jgi:hypothetical protein